MKRSRGRAAPERNIFLSVPKAILLQKGTEACQVLHSYHVGHASGVCRNEPFWSVLATRSSGCALTRFNPWLWKFYFRQAPSSCPGAARYQTAETARSRLFEGSTRSGLLDALGRKAESDSNERLFSVSIRG